MQVKSDDSLVDLIDLPETSRRSSLCVIVYTLKKQKQRLGLRYNCNYDEGGDGLHAPLEEIGSPSVPVLA